MGIFYRKGERGKDKKGNSIMYDLESKINFAVFPGAQGGPHNHTITALATALKQAKSPDYITYQKQVMSNAQSLAKALQSKGYDLVGGKTENHRVLELANIATNKNTVPGDVSAMTPGGIRMGCPALTTRGFTEEDFEKVAEFFDRAVKISVDIKGKTGTKLKDFKAALEKGPDDFPD